MSSLPFIYQIQLLCPKEHIWTKKEIGEYDNKKCHLILNFHGLQGNPPAVVCLYIVSSVCVYVPATAKRYRKKPRQALMSSSLDSLGLSAAVAHVFVCK
jgi:hypothetical protein